MGCALRLCRVVWSTIVSWCRRAWLCVGRGSNDVDEAAGHMESGVELMSVTMVYRDVINLRA